MEPPKTSDIKVWVRVKLRSSGLPGKLIAVSIDELPDSINCYPTMSIVNENNKSFKK